MVLFILLCGYGSSLQVYTYTYRLVSNRIELFSAISSIIWSEWCSGMVTIASRTVLYGCGVSIVCVDVGNIADRSRRRVITAVIKIIDLTYLREPRRKLRWLAQQATCGQSRFIDCRRPAVLAVDNNSTVDGEVVLAVCGPGTRNCFVLGETTELHRRQLTVAQEDALHAPPKCRRFRKYQPDSTNGM